MPLFNIRTVVVGLLHHYVDATISRERPSRTLPRAQKHWFSNRGIAPRRCGWTRAFQRSRLSLATVKQAVAYAKIL